MRSALLLLTLPFLLLACNNRQEAGGMPISDVTPGMDMSTWVKADLACEELRSADDNDPLSVVYLRQLEVQYLIDTVYTCSVIAPQMYTTYEIPHNALSACGGWWAGQGNFYYALQEGDSIAIMHARRPQHDSLGFVYGLMRRFPIANTTQELPDTAQ